MAPPSRKKANKKVPNRSKITKRLLNIKVLPYELVLKDVCETPMRSPEGQQQPDEQSPQMVPEMYHVWLLDRDDQEIHVVPSPCGKQPDHHFGRDPSKPLDNTARQNNPNCFIEYRKGILPAFKGSQANISKDIGVLWRTESPEMQRLCEQIATMKACKYPL